nr:SufD family Fe-S cluster assembly protein [Pyrinomonadaceae bacterium]
VDPELLKTFEKLGIPLTEQKMLANVAVDAVFDSVSVATTYKKKLLEAGVIFCSFTEAVADYPELIQKYLGSVVPVSDNYYAALNSAVFSDGSFVFIPKGVKCPMELSTYFRINTQESGQFERTLIVAEEGAYVAYNEGCHPAGEQVLTTEGWRNIEGIKAGDKVYDHNGKLQKVRAAMVRQFKGEMITVRPMSRYNEFQLTPEHPVYAIKRKDVLKPRKQRKDNWLPEVDTQKLLKATPQFIKADELEKGDFVLVPKLRRQDSTALSANEFEALNLQNIAESDKFNSVVRIPTTNATTNPTLKVSNKIIVNSSLTGTAQISETNVGLHPTLLNSSLSATREVSPIQIVKIGSTEIFTETDFDNEAHLIHETETHFIVPVREVTRESFDDLVFNIDVAETHSYLVKGFAVHNCTAPQFDTNQLHAAVVELVALDDAEIKYSTVQNWYAGDENGKGGIYNFVTKRGAARGKNSKISWTQVETGSAITWKYPSVILQGDNSIGEFYSVALTNNAQIADTGTKMIHIGKNTKSTIISKGISAGKSNNSYRGLVKIMPKAEGARNYTQCDSMLIGGSSEANTFPYIEVMNNTARVEHEATTSKISEEQLFYLQQRGISQEDAVSLIINGFCKEVFRELPMEYAVEATKLLGLKLEGSVG